MANIQDNELKIAALKHLNEETYRMLKVNSSMNYSHSNVLGKSEVEILEYVRIYENVQNELTKRIELIEPSAIKNLCLNLIAKYPKIKIDELVVNTNTFTGMFGIGKGGSKTREFRKTLKEIQYITHQLLNYLQNPNLLEFLDKN